MYQSYCFDTWSSINYFDTIFLRMNNRVNKLVIMLHKPNEDKEVSDIVVVIGGGGGADSAGESLKFA